MQDLWNNLMFPIVVAVGCIGYISVFLLTKFKLASARDYGPREKLFSIAMNIMMLLFLIVNGSTYDPELGGVFSILVYLIPFVVVVLIILIVIQTIKYIRTFMSFASDE